MEGPPPGPRGCPALADSGVKCGACGPSGYGSCVFTPIAAEVARLSRRGLCAAVALALSLTCIALALAASVTLMTDMPAMADTSATTAAASAPAVAVGGYTSSLTDGAVAGAVRAAASPVTSAMLSPMSSMCDSVCVTGVSQVCTVAAGLTVTGLLALLLASRRHTFIGLLARVRARAVPRRGPRQTRWSAPSPISLCVLRV